MVLMDALFTLLNFIFFVVVLGLIIRRSSGAIRQEIALEKHKHAELVSVRKELKNNIFTIEAQLKEQEKLGNVLDNKVVLWRKNFDEHALHESELRLVRYRQLVDRYEKQSLLRAGQRMQARIVPHAIAQARLELYEYFRDDQQAKRYIDQSINDVAGA
jgi:uncharacterized protein (DUF2336 family)